MLLCKKWFNKKKNNQKLSPIKMILFLIICGVFKMLMKNKKHKNIEKKQKMLEDHEHWNQKGNIKKANSNQL